MRHTQHSAGRGCCWERWSKERCTEAGVCLSDVVMWGVSYRGSVEGAPTAMEHPLADALFTSPFNAGMAVTLIPLLIRACVTLKLVGSANVLWALAHATRVPHPAKRTENRIVLTRKEWQGETTIALCRQIATKC